MSPAFSHTAHPSSGQRGPKWKALSTLSGRVQVLLHQSTIASRSCYRSKCAAGCALIRGRQPKPPSELERAVTGTGRRVAGRKTLVPPVLLLSVDVDAARWRERQLGGSTGFAAWRLFAKWGSGASVKCARVAGKGERIERRGIRWNIARCWADRTYIEKKINADNWIPGQRCVPLFFVARYWGVNQHFPVFLDLWGKIGRIFPAHVYMDL